MSPGRQLLKLLHALAGTAPSGRRGQRDHDGDDDPEAGERGAGDFLESWPGFGRWDDWQFMKTADKPAGRTRARASLPEEVVELTAQRLGVVAKAKRIALLEALRDGELRFRSLPTALG